MWQCFSGCSLGTTTHDISPARCEPQLQTTTTCHPYGGVCSFTFEIPCWGDAGLQPGVLDAAPSQCTTWCSAVQPPDLAQGTAACLSVELVDGGSDAGAVLIGQCNGCGI
jgi:hypothetical protein